MEGMTEIPIDLIEPPPKPVTRWQRLAAFAIDLFLAIVISGFVASLIRMLGLSDEPLELVVQSLLLACYVTFGVITIFKAGSPGKLILGFRICDPDGNDLSRDKLFVREFPGKIAGSLFLGFFWLFLNPENRTAWDKIVNSIVAPERRMQRPSDDEVLEPIP